jgi:CheY-like chemotaxis protein
LTERLNGDAGPAILVVEDEALIRLMLAEALLDEGYRVLEAEDAAAALDQLEREPGVALVVSDVRMPGEMDGVGLARWIRRNRPGLKVVLTSGYVSGLDHRGLAQDIDAFIGKPYHVTDVVSRIAQLIEASRHCG